MNETPPLPAPVQTKNCGLAIWSLVLGILGLLCFSIFSAIPAVICGHVAFGRIKRSSGTLAGQGLAIAGMVTGYIGIAWAIVFIPMMLAIAVPNFVKARSVAQMNLCINNLQQIEGAKQQWALEHKKEASETPTREDLDKYLQIGRPVVCPAGGVYKFNSVGDQATCSIPNHKLP